jgi:hypothetical protein
MEFGCQVQHWQEKIMRILFTGCSHTYGGELENRKQKRYSKLISNYYNIEEENVSVSGSSNYDVIINAYNSLSSEHDFCVLQLTGVNRITIPYRDQTLQFFVNKRHYNDQNKNAEILNEILIKAFNPTHNSLCEYNLNLIKLFLSHCKLHKVKPIIFFSKKDFYEWAREKIPNLTILDFTIDDLPSDMLAPFGHANKVGHKLIADKLIQKIDIGM